ncbi:MAG: TIGR03668 family PPOX class F420-dependent oxidoreductase [Thermoleophilia bacterium]
MTEAEMRELVAAARVARLATLTPSGRLHAVPICFALDGDLVYSAVDAKPKRTLELQRLANVAANPEAALLVDHYEDEDWTRLWWVRLRGPSRTVADPAERERALDLLAAKYRQYREARPPGEVLAIAVAEWRGWAAADA